MLDKVRVLENHFIVCGFGRMGRALCDSLSRQGKPFVVIDNDPARVAMAEKSRYLSIGADATQEQTLETARIHSARGVAACLKSDADNVLVTLSARGLSESVTIAARAEEEETRSKLLRAGATRVTCPPVESAARVLQMTLHPAVEELVEFALTGEDIEVCRLSVRELPKMAGHTLEDLQLPAKAGIMVIAVIKSNGRRHFNPGRGLKLSADDELIIIGPPRAVDHLTEEFE